MGFPLKLSRHAQTRQDPPNGVLTSRDSTTSPPRRHRCEGLTVSIFIGILSFVPTWTCLEAADKTCQALPRSTACPFHGGLLGKVGGKEKKKEKEKSRALGEQSEARERPPSPAFAPDYTTSFLKLF